MGGVAPCIPVTTVNKLVMTFAAMIIAFGLVEFFAIALNAGFGWEIETSFIQQPIVLLTIIGITTFIGLAAGLYPAVYLTSFQLVSLFEFRQ